MVALPAGVRAIFSAGRCCYTSTDLWDVHKLRNVQVGLFCEDYSSLLDRQISKIRFEFPPQLGTLREGTVRNFKLTDQYGGGVLALRNLDDPSKYLSSEFAAIGIDELSKNEMSTFEFLRLPCRWPGVEHPKFVAATNPGGIGHVWVKDLWVDKDFAKYPHLAPIKQQFAFIQALASDNPHLPASYWEKLNTLPDHMRRAYADGDWESFAGQFFNIWNQRNQVINRQECTSSPITGGGYLEIGASSIRPAITSTLRLAIRHHLR